MIKYFLLPFALFLLTPSFSQTLGDFRNKGTSNWNASSSWMLFNGTAWVNTTTTPISNCDCNITIIGNFAVTLNIPFTLKAGKTITVDGTLQTNNTTGNILTVNGKIIVSTSGTLNSSSNAKVIVNGTLENSGFVNVSPAARMLFNPGSIYDHKNTTIPGKIPVATWTSSSVCKISGYTTNTLPPSNLNSQTFPNFIWDTPNLSSSFTFDIIGGVTNVSGDFTVNSTGTGKLVFDGGSNYTINVGGNLTILNSSLVRLSNGSNSVITVKGNLSLGASVIDPSTTGSTQIVLNGTNPQSIDANSNTLQDILITGAGAVSLLSPLKLTGVLDIQSAVAVNSNGNLILLSTSDDGANDASIGPITAGGSVVGNVTVQRFMANETNIYRYLSSPVSAMKVSDLQADFPVTGNFSGSSVCSLCTTTPSMDWYNAGTSAYVVFPLASQDGSVTLTPGLGYATYIYDYKQPITIHWKGTVNQGTIALPVSDNGSSQTWNLIGNPYPSTVDWSNTSAWIANNIAVPIAVHDNGTGQYHYYQGADNVSFNEGFIAQGQAIWVRTTGANPSLSITEDAKASPAGGFYRSKNTVEDKIVLSLKGDKITDRAVFKIEADAADGIDKYDAPKMNNVIPFGGGEVIDLSTMTASGAPMSMAINTVKSIQCGDTIQVRMKDMTLGNYDFSISSYGTFSNFKWILKDKFLKTNQPLDSVYTFSVTNDISSKALDRFVLSIPEIEKVAISLDNASNTLASNFASGNQWYFNDLAIKNATQQQLKVMESGTYKVVVTNNGCTTSSQFEFLITGVEKPTNGVSDLIVYPNPATDYVTINVSAAFGLVESVVIYNTLGIGVDTVTLSEVDGSRQGKWDMAGYARGIYMIKVVGANKIISFKVSKQ